MFAFQRAKDIPLRDGTGIDAYAVERFETDVAKCEGTLM